MIAEFFRGLRSYGNAHRVIIRHRLWRFLVIPGILSIAVVIAIIWFGGVYFDNWANTLVQYALPESLRGDATRAIAMVLLWILLVLLAFMTYKHITLAFLAPILGHLSEKTEVLLGHQSAEGFSIARTLQDLGRGITINLRNLLFTLVLTAIVWPLVFVPVIGAVVSTALILMIQAYYGGFGLMDCVLERKRFSVKQSVHFAKLHRGRILGVGSGFMLLLAIPLIGWFLAPAYGTVAATISALEKVEKTESPHKK
ncbi:MAG: EI24 domain-containing protein [Calditrichia bacterium]|nr:EI24 domain-containing protein [Calditrichota bacterium]MCB0268322.1 EI24 domain-containing protein [Calditrichota bacterium]MCB0285480.1 EI24 domain-containing protein [Calditrichota bacterium]MCB9067081.1 EI24 domain-containing protein [Calditrichia bacterium]